MFSCGTCLRRAVHNLTIDQASVSTPTLQWCRRSQLQKQQDIVSRTSGTRRGHATYESLARGHHKRLLRKALLNPEPSSSDAKPRLPPPNARRKGPGALTKGEIKDAIARNQNRANNMVIKDDADDAKMQLKLKREVENWHQDPVHLANQVMRRLQIPDFRAALNLVRASEGVVAGNVVSWNHLADFCMAQGDPDKAWKVYNEMKKRGHRPDAHTYTIMLRGLSANAKNKSSAERAVGIYNSMFAPNSAVVPNTIHTNAVLNVCARTGDMDSLWAIAGRLPIKGPGSPDRWTFTTILNAIRDDATKKVAQLLANPDQALTGGLTVAQRQELIFDAALKDARKLWSDVSHRWRRADMMVDELLVCAMGRLILGCGSKRDFSEVFDLVEQTMNVRLKERRADGSGQHDTVREDTDATPQEDSATRDGHTAEVAVVDNWKPSHLPLDESVVYAQPSNNTLSMLMEAALGSQQLQLGKSYWHLLTTPNGPFKVKADSASIIAYLRVLRVSRSSKAALDVLSQTWPLPVAEKLYRRGTFVIAMSTCMRDKNNPSVFETADKLLMLMQEKLEEQSLHMYSREDADSQLSFKERKEKRREALMTMDDTTFGEEAAQAELQRTKNGVESLSIDPKALHLYLDLALITTKGWNEGLGGAGNVDDFGNALQSENQKFERDSKKNNALKALRRIGPQLPIIQRLAKNKVEELEMASFSRPRSNTSSRWERSVTTGKGLSTVGERLEDLMDLLRSIVGAYDKVIMMAERFEDENLPPLEQTMIQRFRTAKRSVSGFLSRTKDEVAKARAKKYGFSQFKNRAEDVEDDDEAQTDSADSWSGRQGSESSGGGREKLSPAASSERQITHKLRKVYEDTDRDLDRSRSRSRRQRNERMKGVTERMVRRDLASKDVGMLNENLEIEEKERVEQRMRQRAFNIKISGSVNSLDTDNVDVVTRGYTPRNQAGASL